MGKQRINRPGTPQAAISLTAQHVTWNKPITAPWASFQASMTLGVGDNSTWQFLRLK